ncbi:MAG: bifunctional 4-hydroxy-3-methylbut-2-enyl diphosphate reductase/30S ribosomal protein S1 [Clostridia bacterium]|nr:bifunctional 4-hydroxy-3-methylbut-2-enyl diphosphate reductase/30S ribosomal protein S1 [Clostridia bacterium]
MDIIVAKNAGFCFGVKRAIDIVFETIKNKNGDIYTLGPIIHNKQMVDKLRDMGVNVIEDIDLIDKGNVVIRSHGVSPDVYRNQKISIGNINLIDATCPYVKRIHNTVKKYHDKGYEIIILGDSNHPEVIGINGWCNNQANIISSIDDITENINCIKKACVVAQTTLNKNLWGQLLPDITSRIKDIVVFNTICNATEKRQTEADYISKEADVVFVIGGKNSSNTKKLYQICKRNCTQTYLIETVNEINFNNINSKSVVGITAGASTPDWIIREVINKMSEEIKNEQMSVLDEEVINLYEGDIVKGNVLRVDQDQVIVNIGYKFDGVIPKNEILLSDDQQLSELFKEGDSFNVYIKKVDEKANTVILSKKRIDIENAWNKLQQAYDSNQTLIGKVSSIVKGGLLLNIDGIEVFMPGSHVDIKFIKDFNGFMGKDFEVKIIEIDKSKNKVIASRKAVLEQAIEEKKEEIFSTIKVDSVIKGKVKSFTNFGAFIDIGGIDGLIHISDLSWGRIKHPSEVLSIGDEIDVKVLDFDKEKEKISLGYKQTLPDPWEYVDKKYPVGSIIDGKVVRIASFGAFVELEPGVDALLHISQISDKRIEKVEDALKVGDQVKAKVMEVNKKDKRISLSIKETIERQTPKNNKSGNNKDKFQKEEMRISIKEMLPDLDIEK